MAAKIRTGLAAAITAVLLVGVGSAQAATVTLGSSLPPTLTSQSVGSVTTVAQFSLPGATTAAPFDGTITSWRVVGAAGGPWTLQVIHPAGGLFQSTGSSQSGPITGLGVLTFTASLPIKAGDLIGLRSSAVSDKLGVGPSVAGTEFIYWTPPLIDGTAPRTPNGNALSELGFNATVETDCIVPKVKGKSLKKAKNKLLAANCAKGKVKKKGSKQVTKQKPKPGTHLPPDSKVNLTL